MREMIGSLPDQLGWAEEVALAPYPLQASEILVCGMGGSGISGDVAAAVSPDARITVVKDYRLPAWVGAVRPLVAIASYSGSTEEALSTLHEAQGLGLDIVSISSGGPLGGEVAHLTVPGGLQPRAAFGYLSAGLLRLLHAVGVIDDPRPGISEARDVVAMLLGDDLDGPGCGFASDLAEALEGKVPLVYGSSGITGTAAYRWKAQVNENAKLPAASNLIPELDHNELAGWRNADQERRLAIVHLRDRDEHPQVARRFELTKELSKAPTVGTVHSQGEHLLARLFSLTTIGDVVSLYLAEAAGIDPVEVTVLEALKARLQEAQ